MKTNNSRSMFKIVVNTISTKVFHGNWFTIAHVNDNQSENEIDDCEEIAEFTGKMRSKSLSL
jgi:hypothetical protein